MKILITVFFFIFSLTLVGQETGKIQLGRQAEENVVDKKFIMVSSALVASTVFDMESTFAAVGNGAREKNPIMAPFIGHGRAATYGFVMAQNGVTMYVAYRMKKSSNPGIRKMWWVIPVAVTASHALAGGANLRFTF